MIGVIIIIIALLSLYLAVNYFFNSRPDTELPVNDKIVMEAKVDGRKNVLELHIFNHDDAAINGDFFYEIQIFDRSVWKDTNVNALGIEIPAGKTYA